MYYLLFATKLNSSIHSSKFTDKKLNKQGEFYSWAIGE